MKTVITFFAAILFTVASFANSMPARLKITSMSNTNLRIIVDGNKYDNMGNALSLNNLRAGYHDIKIYEIRKGWGNRDRLMYSSSVFFKPDVQMNIFINRSGDVAVAEQRSDRYEAGRYGNNDNRNDNRRNDRDDYGKQADQDNRRGYPSGRY